MKRVLFGKRAEKKAKIEDAQIVYKAGDFVLGNLFREKKGQIEFFLPNGRTAICYKEYIREEITGVDPEGKNLNSSSFFVKQFDKDMYVELLVLGERNQKYECTFFTQKQHNIHSLATGIIQRQEEVGYTVEIGVPTKVAVVKTEKKYSEGELAVFQVTSLSLSAYMLTDQIDREIYIGERSEICPGILLRTKITGRPKYIAGEPRKMHTNMPYSYTAEALGVCLPIVESRERYEVDDEMVSIIIYVSENRESVHAIPYEEYKECVNRRCPPPSLVGKLLTARVERVNEKHLSLRSEEIPYTGILMPMHYSDVSTSSSSPLIKENDLVQVRVFSIRGYTIYFTAKETLVREEPHCTPISEGSIVFAVAKNISDSGIYCSTFGEDTILIRRLEEEDVYVGKMYKIQVTKKAKDLENIFFGTRWSEYLPKIEKKTLADKLADKEKSSSSSIQEKPIKRKRAEIVIDPKKQEEDKIREAEREKYKESIRAAPIEQKENENLQSIRKKKSKNTSKYTSKDRNSLKTFSNGDIVEGVIKKVYQYGAFASIASGLCARIKISEISSRFVQDWQSLVHVGQRIKIVLYNINYEEGLVEGSIKKYEVLQMAENAEPEATTPLDEQIQEPPLVYNIEKEEEEEEEEVSEEDEEFEMEIFNSKNSSAPWTKRIFAFPLNKAYKLWKASIAASISPETKKETTIAMITAVANNSADKIPSFIEIESIIMEGVHRDGTIFLKKALDNCRNLPNQKIHYALCMKYIQEKRESTFGYKELIFHAVKNRSVSVLEEIKNRLANTDCIKAAEKKEIDAAYIEAVYKLSKNQGRAEIEKKILAATTKAKAELAIKYVQLEMQSIESTPDIEYTRNVLEKCILSYSLSQSAVKNLFKAYLKLEKEYGTKDREEIVLTMAKEYVSQATQ